MFWRPQFKASSLPFNELLKGILSLKLSGWFNMRESETWLHYTRFDMMVKIMLISIGMFYIIFF